MQIERVGVIGCGLMGAGIAEASARSGASVTVIEADITAVGEGRARVERSLQRGVEGGKLDGAAAEEVKSRISYGTEFAALCDCELVVEAVSEREDLKVSVLASASAVLSPTAILATNTSSFPIARLGRATDRPDRFLGLHFFNPVPVMPLVEVVSSLRTANEVVSACERYVTEQLRKRAIHAGDRSGFVVNSLLVPYLLAAVRMVEARFADAETVDAGMEGGCGHPLGPLRLADLIGLDTLVLIADAMHEEYREPQFVAPPLLRRMVDAGFCGRKSGRGFYEYEQRR